jgi:hypothetical protein
VSRGIFGGGAFSVARGMQVRMVGGEQRTLSEIGISRLTGAHRAKNGTMSYALMPPFIPTTLRQDLHHGGTSLCFAIQIAHLMGADPIYAVGFTLQNGSNYFFSRTNPVTRKPTVYQHERALAWLAWYQSKFPGRVLLDPSFNGPVYDVFKKANFDARETTTGNEPPVDRGHEPKPDRVHADQVASRPVAKRPEPTVPARPAQRGRVIGGRPHNRR